MERHMVDDEIVRTPGGESEDQPLMARTAAEWEIAWAARRMARLGRYGTGEGQPIESGWSRDDAE